MMIIQGLERKGLISSRLLAMAHEMLGSLLDEDQDDVDDDDLPLISARLQIKYDDGIAALPGSSSRQQQQGQLLLPSSASMKMIALPAVVPLQPTPSSSTAAVVVGTTATAEKGTPLMMMRSDNAGHSRGSSYASSGVQVPKIQLSAGGIAGGGGGSELPPAGGGRGIAPTEQRPVAPTKNPTDRRRSIS